MYWVLCSYGTYLAERILIVTRHPLSGLLQLSCSYPLISTEKILYGFGSGFGLGFFCVWVWRLVLGFKEEILLYLFLTCLLRQRRLGHSVCPCSNQVLQRFSTVALMHELLYQFFCTSNFYFIYILDIFTLCSGKTDLMFPAFCFHCCNFFFSDENTFYLHLSIFFLCQMTKYSQIFIFVFWNSSVALISSNQ